MNICKTNFYFFLTLLALFGTHITSKAQPWMKPPYYNNINPDSTRPVLLKDIQQAFEKWQEAHAFQTAEDSAAPKGEEQEKTKPGWMQFKRWENYMKPRTFPSGDISLPSRNYQNYMEYLQAHAAGSSLRSAGSPTGNWIAEGPFGDPYGDGAGRVSFMRFNPQNINTIWIGAPSGGLWKSTDGALTWGTNTDALSVIGCSDIAINPLDTNVMYLATGDGDADANYSVGVLRSDNAGITWNSTGLVWPVSSLFTIYKMAINPVDTSIVLVASNRGLYRTNNSGISWTLIVPGPFTDVAFKPESAETVYAVSNSFYISSDSGFTFISAGTGLPDPANVQRMEIAVSAEKPSYVYVVASDLVYSAFLGLYRSTDGGMNFVTQATSPNLLGYETDGSDLTTGGGWYTLSIAANPTDAEDIYVGGVNHWHSTDGGADWNCITQWYGCCGFPYVHADVHNISFLPGSGNQLFSCNDGGVFSSGDNGNTWTDVSGNLQIAQMYRLGCSASDSTLAMEGSQDNGSNFMQDTVWTSVLGGDGMECIIDYNNADIIYGEYYYGNIYQTLDGWNTSNNIVTSGFDGINSNGAWVTPYIMNPLDDNTLLVGKDQVYRTSDAGLSWNQVGQLNLNGELITALAYAPSNPDYIYVATPTQLFVSTDGNTFKSIVHGLPVLAANITYIAVSNTNPDKVWVTFSGYASTNKVYASYNAGLSWSDYSTGLPNLPVNCIAYQNNTNDGLYAGTDAGVYFRSNSLSEWQPFSTGLPNVVVDEMEIQYQMNKIRAATYGRGLWKSDLAIPVAGFSASITKACEGSAITFTDQSSGSPVSWYWTLPGAVPDTSTEQNPTVTYNVPGTYAVTLQVSNANGNETLTQQTSVSIGPKRAISNIMAALCRGTYNFNGKEIGQAGTYTDTLLTPFGCDSIINLTLYTDTLPGVSLSLTPDTICHNITQVTLGGGIPPGGTFAGSGVSGTTFNPGEVSPGMHLITYSITGANNCTNTDSAYISVEVCTGIEQPVTNNLITLYPNPAGSLITVQSGSFNFLKPIISFYDLTGRLLTVPVEYETNKALALIEDLAEGPYWIKIETSGNIVTRPFIKMK